MLSEVLEAEKRIQARLDQELKQAEKSLGEVKEATAREVEAQEQRLRQVMGLPESDGRSIRPSGP